MAIMKQYASNMSLSYKAAPRWLENSALMRKLFLLRKVFLTRSSRRYYSQFGEDVVVDRLFPKGYKGIYIDVGCYHPTKFSNTWMLYQAGWRGINIDIDSIKVEAFRMRRPDDVNVQCAVSNRKGELTYFSNGFYSLTVSVSPEFVAGDTRYQERKCKCAPLTEIIDSSRYRDQAIDLLSVDAEGHDLEVLQSLDFSRYSPKVIAVECHGNHLKEVMESPVYAYLTQRCYSLVGWTGLTTIFASESHSAQLWPHRPSNHTQNAADSST
jgi:FkbM family methyltransferase